jgi:pseudouridine-5'-phosphate glycosidase
MCCIGLSSEELQDLAKAGGEKRAQKCSTRELSLIIAKQRSIKGRYEVPHQWGGKQPFVG